MLNTLDATAYPVSGGVLFALAIGGWLAGIARRDVGIVDSLWSLMILAAVVVYAFYARESGPRAVLVVALVAVWALRLSVYITWRNCGQGEDYRYREIRRNNEPGFAFKSLYLVFGLQAALAWIIAVSPAVALRGGLTVGPLDLLAIALWAVGFGFETVADWQLARFKRLSANRGKVLDEGLWAYTRHPNYFGECLVWWAFYLFSVGAGGWWTIFSPLLMTFLLLKVSGVAMLEQSIVERRPEYANYKRRTNAFLPGPRHGPSAGAAAR